jgi:hypothetical protein
MSDTSLYLYNLRDNIKESRDLADKHPDVVKQLLDSWKVWSEPFPVSASEQKKFTIK